MPSLVIQSPSHVRLCEPMYCSTLDVPVFHHLLEVLPSLCPLNWWCYPTISSSATFFSFCLQSLPPSVSFPVSWLLASGSQSIGASASVLPMNIQDWFLSGLTGLISLQSRDSQESSPAPQFKSINSLALSFLYSPTLTYMTTGKTIALTRQTFVGKVMSLLFNMLSRLVITFLPRSKCLLISWLQSPSAVILEPLKNSLSLFALFPQLFAMKWWDQMPYS